MVFISGWHIFLYIILFDKLRPTKSERVRANEPTISVTELKNLVTELKERQPDIGFRFRLMGEMWHPNFLKIFKVHEKGMTLIDEIANKLVFINELSTVIQFEL